MLEPKERERSEALTTSKHKQPGAGKQFTSRSLRGEKKTTRSELFGSTWALPRSNGSPCAYRSAVIFLSDISVNKVANDHTREASEGFKESAASLDRRCRRGSHPAASAPCSASGRGQCPGVRREGVGGHGAHGFSVPAADPMVSSRRLSLSEAGLRNGAKARSNGGSVEPPGG